MSAIDRELKRGTLEMILLHLLAGQEMYGYQLSAALDAQSEGQFRIKEGTLYPVLYRLEDAGLIEARWETPERGNPRKYYRVTRTGRKQLQALIDEWETFVSVVNRLLAPEEV